VALRQFLCQPAHDGCSIAVQLVGVIDDYQDRLAFPGQVAIGSASIGPVGPAQRDACPSRHLTG
jgi:hypothetical protein